MPTKITRHSCNICQREYTNIEDAARCERVGIAGTLEQGIAFIAEPYERTKNSPSEEYLILRERIRTRKHNAVYRAVRVYLDCTAWEVPAPYWTYAPNFQVEVSPGNYLFDEDSLRTRMLSKSEIEALTVKNSTFKEAFEKVSENKSF